MDLSLSAVFGWIVTYRYGILLPLAIVEGPIISVIAGFLISIGQMNFAIAFGLLAAGDVIGDLLLYGVGRWGGLKLFERHGSRFGITPQRIRQLEGFFEKHAKKTLLFGKWGHAFGLPILVTAGVAREPIGEFLGVSILGTIPKTLLLLLIGFYFGASYGLIDHYLNYFIVATLLLVVAVGFGYWFFRKTIRKYFSEVA